MTNTMAEAADSFDDRDPSRRATVPAAAHPLRHTKSDRMERRAPRQWIYRNLTPWRIEYRRAATESPVLTIPPLGEVRVAHGDCAQWDTSALRQRGQLDVVPAPVDALERLPGIVLLFGWASVATTAMLWAVARGHRDVPTRALMACALGVPALALVAAGVREVVHARRFYIYREHRRSGSRPTAVHSLGVGYAGDDDGLPVRVARQLAETLVLAGSLTVAVVGSALAIYLTSQLRDVLPFDAHAGFVLGKPSGTERLVDSTAVWQLLVGHVAQWTLVWVAALVPAAMFFQFDRERLAAIQGRWVRHVFRLDPTVRSLRDVRAKYGAHMEASFGSLDTGSSTRVRRGRRSPVVVATILTTVGWVVLAASTRVPELRLVDGRYVWPDGGFQVAQFFQPQGSALGFAFLGAYLFSILHVVRGYQRRDLLPKTYNTIVVRYLAAYILTLAAELVVPGDALDNRALMGFAFFAGFLPQSALVWVRERLTTIWHRDRNEGLDEGVPLTELEGIDLYDRTRLAEEGVNNVHALAHADLVELMSATRISADRLVDWTDQAILFLRVGGDRLGVDRHDALSITRLNMHHLRSYGIRNASDLLQAYDAALARAAYRSAGKDPDEARLAVQEEVDQFRDTLTTAGMPCDAKTGYLAIQGMLDTLPDEEWFTQIRNWRCSEFDGRDASLWYLDGSGPWPNRAEACVGRVGDVTAGTRSLPMKAP